MARRDLEFAGLDETWLLITTAISAETAIVQSQPQKELALEAFRRTVEALLEKRNRDQLQKRLNALQFEVEKSRIFAPVADHHMNYLLVEYGIILEEAARGKLLRFERIRLQ